MVGSAASSPFGGPVSPNGENPSPSSKESMEQQINLTLSFTQENGLTFNPQKCEVVVMSKTKDPKEVVCSIDQQQLIPKDAAKCLGFWWSWNLAAKTAVDEAVKKARRAFFLFGGMPRRPESVVRKSHL